MAQLGDDPAYPVQQAPEEEPVAQVGKIADEWRSWMQEPGNRSSLMQFGIPADAAHWARPNSSGALWTGHRRSGRSRRSGYGPGSGGTPRFA